MLCEASTISCAVASVSPKGADNLGTASSPRTDAAGASRCRCKLT